MDLKQLQYFVVCAQTGSFSDAAKNLYSTQPSVSKVIKGLEDTLGFLPEPFFRFPYVQGYDVRWMLRYLLLNNMLPLQNLLNI